MTSIANRCLAAVVMALAMNSCLLLMLSAVLDLRVDAHLALGLLCVAALSLVLAALLLRPLRADLEWIANLIASEDAGAAQALSTAPRSAEANALFASVAFMRARSIELDEAETRARRALEEAERLRVSFVAAMGHDLRGPLNSITGFSDLLVMDEHDAVGPAQRTSVEIIRRSAQDLLVLLEQILDWARLEAGQITLEKTTLQLSDVIASAARVAVARSADRGLRIERAIEANLPALCADRERLCQALLGLMDHATRAADQPRLVIRARVATESEPPCMRIELRDPQLCVREADHASFFEAFRASYAPSGRRVAGLGLGPALARALIRAHGGRVWFTSRPDTGTTFSVELPLIEDRDRASEC